MESGKEVKKRVQAGRNGWRKVSGVLCDRKISARIKGKVHRTVVRPAMLYGLETVSLKKRQESELEVAELKMLRSVGGTRFINCNGGSIELSLFMETQLGSVIHTCFKESIIVPVPKKTHPASLNDFRTVALTSVVMKCLERLVRDFIISSLPNILDPLQFAYRPNRSTDDASSHLLHTSLTHLDTRKGNYVKMPFVNYSSVFNTIIPSTLITKLQHLGLSPSLCQWITNFLTSRPQAVRMGRHVSVSLILSTGAPRVVF
ncbi:hypothetical protein QTP70_000710 [Hemibagrus guttatus]|uniref:Reverse transcriptase domain-containing protein n=1 Tax=Hemibagrus guttatus TaxID=175788 RepID=A0AAE0URA5_9TELE|nr:hypothetical protein QTP70_000710 [Hemibagrus guttatus]KAK3541685.1 hypothetical protein QTP86_000576 [Hemibagrus guttatus]